VFASTLVQVEIYEALAARRLTTNVADRDNALSASFSSFRVRNAAGADPAA
jgi:hypothetical protein